MDFEHSEQQQLIRAMVREFAQREVAPIAKAIDKSGEFPLATVKKMAQLGLLGMVVPPEYGGSGTDTVSYAIAIEELSRICASHGVIVSVNNSLACWPILHYGTEEQKQRYLVPMAKGEELGAYALTEPAAGSDAAKQKATAVLDGDSWLLNGNKIFITCGGAAQTYVLFAMTEPAKRYKGITAFIVPRDVDGLTVGTEEEKMGIRATATTEIFLSNVRIPKENVLGEVGQGFKVAMNTLNGGRIGIAAQALGIAQGCLDEAVAYAKVREAFGKTLGQMQAIQWMLADIATDVEVSRLLTYRAAWHEDTGADYIMSSAMAKLFAAEACVTAARKAVQIYGGYGYSKDYPVERFYRDSKITEIYEGTNEIQRVVIAGQLGLR